MRAIYIALVMPAAMLSAVVPGVRAQPIFTTAPPHLQGIKPPPAPERTAPQSAPSLADRQHAPQAPTRMLPIPGFPHAPATLTPAQVSSPSLEAAPVIAQPRPEPAPGSGQSGAKSSERVIRHLTNNIQGYRLSGEIGTSEWPVYFTQAQTQDRLQF